jgi:ADP-ribose pyrophosphatase YjhB (NUDIX family)
MADHQTSPRPGVGVAVIVWRDGKALFYDRRGAHGHGTW